MANALGDMIKVFKALKNFNKVADLSVQVYELESVERQIGDLQNSYVKNRSVGNEAAIRIRLNQISAYLNHVVSSSQNDQAGSVTSQFGSAARTIKSQQAMLAQQLLTDIAHAEAEGSLPSSDAPWPIRRASFLRIRHNLLIMAREFERLAADKGKLIETARAHQFVLLQAATDPGQSKADLDIYKADMTEQLAAEKLALEYQQHFRSSAQASKKSADRLGAIVAAVDLATHAVRRR